MPFHESSCGGGVKLANAEEIEMDPDFGSKRMRAGVLTINLKRAERIKGDEFWGFGKADPYAVLSLGDKTTSNRKQQRSSVHTNGGSNPVWNDVIEFVIEHSGLDKSILYIELYDKDILKNDSLGSLKIDIAHLLEKHYDNVPEKWYSVYQGWWHKARGKLLLSFSFQELADQGDSVSQKKHPSSRMGAANLAVGIGQLVAGVSAFVLAAP